jgi:hypothetical protein
MKVPWRERSVLPAVDKAGGNQQRVKPFQTEMVQVDLIRLWGQLLPERPGKGLGRILNEIISPDFPGDQHGVIGTLSSKII